MSCSGSHCISRKRIFTYYVLITIKTTTHYTYFPWTTSMMMLCADDDDDDDRPMRSEPYRGNFPLFSFVSFFVTFFQTILKRTNAERTNLIIKKKMKIKRNLCTLASNVCIVPQSHRRGDRINRDYTLWTINKMHTWRCLAVCSRNLVIDRRIGGSKPLLINFSNIEWSMQFAYE